MLKFIIASAIISSSATVPRFDSESILAQADAVFALVDSELRANQFKHNENERKARKISEENNQPVIREIPETK